MRQPEVDDRDEATQTPTLEQLIANTREVYATHAAQARGIAELAFMEFDLAVATFHWWLGTLALFGVASIMTCTLLIAATVIVFTESTISPTLMLLVMGSASAGVTFALMLALRFLYQKMTFRTLRQHLTQPGNGAHATAKATA